ncbi:MAG: ATP-dependent helicase [Coriobacteriia bacterium]|nr:ATP-dependent helicase [Coriobacteriia bacterium]
MRAEEQSANCPTASGDIEPAASSTLLASLNERQRQAASHGEEALLIVAGAGTGKTATLAHRVTYLMASGTDPGRILLLTFTRRAASEMLRRVDSIMRAAGLSGAGSSAGSTIWGGTFHSVAVRLLRLHGRDIGLEPDFTVLDRSDAEDLMHVARTELGLGQAGRRFPQKSTCLDIYSRCVNTCASVDHVVGSAFPWCKDDIDALKELFALFTDHKEAQRVLDYDDLLLFWHAMLSQQATAERIQSRFDHVLVDEYQDTNVLQAEIVSLLRPDGTRVTAVGDDAQAIYGFRGATVRNILDFEKRFPGAEVVTLERNYRSTAPILDASNLLIAEADERREKHLYTERDGGARPTLASCQDEAEQTDYLVERILGHREQGTLLREQAVLFRAAHHSAHLEIELSRRNIPYIKYGGLKFIEMAHVKDLMAFLRLAENPRDLTAGMRVLGLVPGIGPKTAADAMQTLAASDADFESWVSLRIPEAARGAWPDLVTLMRGLAGAAPSDLPAQVHAIRSVYAPLLELRYDNVDARLRDLEQIEALASRFGDRSRFLAEIAIDPPAYTQDLAGPPLLDEDYLILSTIHSAKGLEFDVVYVIHAADGNIPSDMATGTPEEIEEERRLFYVACTRARNDLYVTWPLRYYAQPFGMSDTHGYAQRTRFITPAVRHAFAETLARPEAEFESAEDAPPITTTADVRAGLKRMWT